MSLKLPWFATEGGLSMATYRISGFVVSYLNPRFWLVGG